MMFPLCVCAQGGDIRRGNCTPQAFDDSGAKTRGVHKALATIKTDWDPQKIYRQPVVLISFSDTDFSMENPREFYDSLFNYAGFNKGKGPGCVADYYREQSGGILNLQFDVFGPYKISQIAKRNANANANTYEHGSYAMTEATGMWIAEDATRQYEDYDWNGDKNIDQVIYIYAGYAGNQNNEVCYGHIWPNTSSFSRIQTNDGYWVSNYTCSGELALDKNNNNRSWGIGTICHEFTHSLGLPDIYPTSSSAGYSMVDEWDLMDGGNFINAGWCPPNFSGLERMLMGWQTPIELTEATTITGMKALSDGGPVYLIKHTDNEYYLLENRQWSGWDAYLPGRGLVVFHVLYSASSWNSNSVNNNQNRRGYQLVHADNLDYDAWEAHVKEGKYTYEKGHNPYLSTSAYPWSTDSTDFVNNQLTDKSTPASLMYDPNEAGSRYLSKAIRNISMTDDGLISFDFDGYDLSPVRQVSFRAVEPTRVYDLNGRYVGQRLESQRPGLYIVKQSDGTTKKVVKR